MELSSARGTYKVSSKNTKNGQRKILGEYGGVKPINGLYEDYYKNQEKIYWTREKKKKQLPSEPL